LGIVGGAQHQCLFGLIGHVLSMGSRGPF
jgi:hypothetical protein